METKRVFADRYPLLHLGNLVEVVTAIYLTVFSSGQDTNLLADSAGKSALRFSPETNELDQPTNFKTLNLHI